MSAFLVAADAINSIVTYLHERNAHFGWFGQKFGYDLSQREGVERLARALFELNVKALAERYGKGTAANDGDVPEQKLFKALEEISGQIASRIVLELPAYDSAPWGD